MNRGLSGADDQVRTGDLNLGKVALYQLSYIRVCWLLSQCFLSKAMQMYNHSY